MLASVSTRVVSWKLAAEINESVESDGLGDAQQERGESGMAAVRRSSARAGSPR